MMNWVMLAYSLPTGSTSGPRVAIWRRLKRLGAVAPAGGLYLLPGHADRLEAFQWLAVEIRDAGGEALVVTGEAVSGLTDDEIVQAFNHARNEDYREIASDLKEFDPTLDRDVKTDELADALTQFNRLRGRFVEVRSIDYFDAPAGVELGRRLEHLMHRFTAKSEPEVNVLRRERSNYQARVWVTRTQPHVDRLSSIWLIRRFIDDQASIRFGAPESDDDVTFDMDGAEIGHIGPLCTFEVLLRSFDISTPELTELAEIVHQADLWDDRFPHPSAPGVDAILRGWIAEGLDDESLVARGCMLMDGLICSLAEAHARSLEGRSPS